MSYINPISCIPDHQRPICKLIGNQIDSTLVIDEITSPLDTHSEGSMKKRIKPSIGEKEKKNIDKTKLDAQDHPCKKKTSPVDSLPVEKDYKPKVETKFGSTDVREKYKSCNVRISSGKGHT